jgi:hypothetical protein
VRHSNRIDPFSRAAEADLALSNLPERQIEHPEPFGFTDIILPSQFFGSMGGKSFCAEQRLMLAVLIDAINILQGWNRLGSARKRRAFAEAGQWVTTRRCDYPFSFDSVCDALNIDPEMLRKRLANLVMGLGAEHRLGAVHLRFKEFTRREQVRANRVRRQKPPRLVAGCS